MTGIVIFVWWQYEVRTLNEYRINASTISKQLAIRLDENIQYHLSALHHLKYHWEKYPVTTREKFEDDVADIFSQFPGFQAINFVDTTGTILWIYPEATNLPAKGKNLYSHPSKSVSETFERAKNSHLVSVTPPVDLLQGGKGYASYFPIVKDSTLLGFINGVFRIEDIIKQCLSRGDLENFVYYIDDDTTEIYSSTSDTDVAVEILGSYSVLIFDRFWTVYVTLSPEVLKSMPRAHSILMLFAGLFFSMAVAYLIKMIIDRQLRLFGSEKKFRQLVENLNLGIIISRDTRIIYSNPEASKIIGYSTEELRSQSIIDFFHKEDRSKINRRFDELELMIEDGHNGGFEVRFIDKDHSEKWVKFNCLKIDWEEEPALLCMFLDITKSREIYQKLIVSETRYRHLFENIQDGVLVHDGKRIMFCNEASIRLIGAKSATDLIDRSIFEFVHPDYQEVVKERVNFILTKKESVPIIEEKIIRFDDQVITCEVTAGPILYMGKEAIQIVIRDISERKKMEKEIEEREFRYKTLFESSVNALFIMKDNKFIDCNSHTLELFRCTREQIIGKTPDVFSPPVQPSGEKSDTLALKRIKSAFKGNTEIFEWVHKRQDETLFDAEVTLKKVVLSGESHLLATVQDITEEKRVKKSEKVLFRISQAVSTTKSLDELFRTIHKHLSTLIDTTNFYIALYDSKKDIISFPYFIDEKDPPPDGRKLTNGLTDYVLRRGESLFLHEEEIINLAKAGKIELLGTPSKAWLGAPLMMDGKTLGIIVVQSYTNRDLYDKGDMDILNFVSEQVALSINSKLIEESLRESAWKFKQLSSQLSESNALKELLLDVVSHDLKNPAGVLSGVAEIMLVENPDNEYAKIIQESTRSLLHVIENATTLSKVAIGEEIDKIEMNLAEMIRRIVQEFKPQLMEADMDVELKLDDELKIYNNPIISEVFKNYISNAIKYASHGKKITIEMVVEDKMVTVNVIDYGRTISPKEYVSIFKRGIQLGKGIKKGRGLGLSIVKRISEAHNGEVGIRPNLPTGNIFYLKLPINPNEPDSQTEESKSE